MDPRPVPLVLLAAAFSGCFGPGVPAALDEPPATVWERDFRTGWLVGLKYATASLGPNHIEPFEIPLGTLHLRLRIETGDGDFHAFVLPPGCPRALASECDHRVDTEHGLATWTTAGPEPGRWGVDFYRKNQGASTMAFALEIETEHPAPGAKTPDDAGSLLV